MIGYRNFFICIAAIGTSAFLIYVGIVNKVDLLGLATVVGAKDGAAGLAILGRGYNKKAENGHGGG